MLVSSPRGGVVAHLPLSVSSEIIELNNDISYEEAPIFSYKKTVQIMENSFFLRSGTRLMAITFVMSSLEGHWAAVHLCLADRNRTDRSLIGESIAVAIATTVVALQLFFLLKSVKNKVNESSFFCNEEHLNLTCVPALSMMTSLAVLIFKSSSTVESTLGYLFGAYIGSSFSLCSSLFLENLSADPLAIKLFKTEKKELSEEVELEKLL